MALGECGYKLMSLSSLDREHKKRKIQPTKNILLQIHSKILWCYQWTKLSLPCYHTC